jgi:hypothetical protein
MMKFKIKIKIKIKIKKYNIIKYNFIILFQFKKIEFYNEIN